MIIYIQPHNYIVTTKVELSFIPFGKKCMLYFSSFVVVEIIVWLQGSYAFFGA